VRGVPDHGSEAGEGFERIEMTALEVIAKKDWLEASAIERMIILSWDKRPDIAEQAAEELKDLVDGRLSDPLLSATVGPLQARIAELEAAHREIINMCTYENGVRMYMVARTITSVVVCAKSALGDK